MNFFQKHAEFFNQPIRLSDEDRKAPEEVVRYYFGAIHLYEIRKYLAELVDAAITSPNLYFEEAESRESIIIFRDMLEECLEAASLIYGVNNTFVESSQKHASPGTLIDDHGQYELLQYIIRMVQPERILRLPCTNSPEQRTDLLIVMPPDIRKSFSELDTIIELCTFKTKQVTCSIYHSAQWRDYVERGFLFYCMLSDEKYSIYTAPGSKTPPVANQDKLKQSILIAQQLFSQGHTKSLSFLKSAIAFQSEENYPMAAFALQQATELVLRYFILALTGLECKTHSLRTLRKHLERYAPQICSVFAADHDEDIRLMSLLEHAYLDARYKEDFRVQSHEIETLIHGVGLLLENVTKAFNTITEVLK